MTVELCREPIVVEGDVTLGIHSNVADRSSHASGHAWVSVSTPAKTYYLGLWPDGHPRAVDNRGGCTDARMGIETGVQPTVSRYYRLTANQNWKLAGYINRPEVWKYTHTSAGWANQLIFEVLGIRLIPIQSVAFASAGELGKEIQKLEQQNSTTRLTPNPGDMVRLGVGMG